MASCQEFGTRYIHSTPGLVHDGSDLSLSTTTSRDTTTSMESNSSAITATTTGSMTSVASISTTATTPPTSPVQKQQLTTAPAYRRALTSPQGSAACLSRTKSSMSTRSAIITTSTDSTSTQYKPSRPPFERVLSLSQRDSAISLTTPPPTPSSASSIAGTERDQRSTDQEPCVHFRISPSPKAINLVNQQTARDSGISLSRTTSTETLASLSLDAAAAPSRSPSIKFRIPSPPKSETGSSRRRSSETFPKDKHPSHPAAPEPGLPNPYRRSHHLRLPRLPSLRRREKPLTITEAALRHDDTLTTGWTCCRCTHYNTPWTEPKRAAWRRVKCVRDGCGHGQCRKGCEKKLVLHSARLVQRQREREEKRGREWEKRNPRWWERRRDWEVEYVKRHDAIVWEDRMMRRLFGFAG